MLYLWIVIDTYHLFYLFTYLLDLYLPIYRRKNPSIEKDEKKKKILKIGIIIELLYFLTGMCEINEWVSGSDCGSVV